MSSVFVVPSIDFDNNRSNKITLVYTPPNNTFNGHSIRHFDFNFLKSAPMKPGDKYKIVKEYDGVWPHKLAVPLHYKAENAYNVDESVMEKCIRWSDFEQEIVIHDGEIFNLKLLKGVIRCSSGLYLCKWRKSGRYEILEVSTFYYPNGDTTRVITHSLHHLGFINKSSIKKQELTLDNVLEQLYDISHGKKTEYSKDLLLDKYEELTGEKYRWVQ